MLLWNRLRAHAATQGEKLALACGDIRLTYAQFADRAEHVALITGASSGIGLGLTRGFLAAGFNVVANSRRVTAAGTLTPSDDLMLVDGDVGEAPTARNLINSAEQRFGRIDVLIN